MSGEWWFLYVVCGGLGGTLGGSFGVGLGIVVVFGGLRCDGV